MKAYRSKELLNTATNNTISANAIRYSMMESRRGIKYFTFVPLFLEMTSTAFQRLPLFFTRLH